MGVGMHEGQQCGVRKFDLIKGREGPAMGSLCESLPLTLLALARFIRMTKTRVGRACGAVGSRRCLRWQRHPRVQGGANTQRSGRTSIIPGISAPVRNECR